MFYDWEAEGVFKGWTRHQHVALKPEGIKRRPLTSRTPDPYEDWNRSRRG